MMNTPSTNRPSAVRELCDCPLSRNRTSLRVASSPSTPPDAPAQQALHDRTQPPALQQRFSLTRWMLATGSHRFDSPRHSHRKSSQLASVSRANCSIIHFILRHRQTTGLRPAMQPPFHHLSLPPARLHTRRAHVTTTHFPSANEPLVAPTQPQPVDLLRAALPCELSGSAASWVCKFLKHAHGAVSIRGKNKRRLVQAALFHDRTALSVTAINQDNTSITHPLGQPVTSVSIQRQAFQSRNN
jgi:hypothetical protein